MSNVDRRRAWPSAPELAVGGRRVGGGPWDEGGKGSGGEFAEVEGAGSARAPLRAQSDWSSFLSSVGAALPCELALLTPENPNPMPMPKRLPTLLVSLPMLAFESRLPSLVVELPLLALPPLSPSSSSSSFNTARLGSSIPLTAPNTLPNTPPTQALAACTLSPISRSKSSGMSPDSGPNVEERRERSRVLGLRFRVGE
jgi:hypothetical protein